jgi:hypothetical protein
MMMQFKFQENAKFRETAILLVLVQVCRLNLTTSAARPNPQGSYHYEWIKIKKTYIFANSALKVMGKVRFMVKGVTSLRPSTPLMLA